MQRYIIELYFALADGEKNEKPKDYGNDNKRNEIIKNKKWSWKRKQHIM